MLAQHLKGSGTDVDVAVNTPSFWDMSCKISYEFNIMKICRLNLRKILTKGSYVTPDISMVHRFQDHWLSEWG